MKTPLQILNEKEQKKCCLQCDKLVEKQGITQIIYLCGQSEKIILPMFLDIKRIKDCGYKGDSVEISENMGKYISLENYMISQGISLREFADRCGIAPSTMSRFLNGKTDIQKSNIDKILKVTGLTYEECFEVIEPFA